MTLRRMLANFMRVVIEEAERNPDFETRIRDALAISGKALLGTDETGKSSKNENPNQRKSDGATGEPAGAKRASNRRPPAVLDPVRLAREGEQVLRIALTKLNLEQLLDVVAEYGMDPGKLVMKWKTSERVIERIVEISLSRAHKGDAFRPQANIDNVQELSSDREPEPE